MDYPPLTNNSIAPTPIPVWYKPKHWLTPQIRHVEMGTALFLVAALIYLLSISIGLDQFPIYFFTDEAAHANLASDFITGGFSSSDGSFLPTYFLLDPTYGLNGTSVYIQILPTILFGKTVLVSRLVPGLITLLAAILIGLLLKQVFHIRSYWLGILLMITSPAWFLHARTAFEYMEVASFFAATLYFYNLYRQGKDKYLYVTIFSAALMFYTHGLGQVLTGLTAIFFFLSDFRYHFQPERRHTLLIALGLAVLLSLPYFRYILANPSAMADEVRARNSYWMDKSTTLQQKTTAMLDQYLIGTNPKFWFIPTDIDLIRHRMKGYGNILWFMLPFAGLGIIRTLLKIRQSEYRTVLIALLVAPIPATIVAIDTPRVIWMVIPWAILIALGIDWASIWLLKSVRLLKFETLNLVLFVFMAALSIYILRDALVNGPTWYTDYGLYGMQYGAKQVFQDTIVPELKNDPNLKFFISPAWANGTNQFAQFFLTQDLLNRTSFGTPNDILDKRNLLSTDTVFILTPDEYKNFSNDPRFSNIHIRQTISYPDDQPGFYFITLSLSDKIDQILAAQHAANRKPVEDKVIINGQTTRILHSPIGSGSISDTFDDDPNTLSRVLEANPYIFDLYPAPPLSTPGVVIQTGALPNFTINIDLYAPGAAQPVHYSKSYVGLPADPLVTIPFDRGPSLSSRIYIEIEDNISGEMSKIQVRTIQFK